VLATTVLMLEGIMRGVVEGLYALWKRRHRH
jgi:hypothetical protein